MSRISFKHPEWQRIKDRAQDKFDHDFNIISHEVVKKVFGECDFEQVQDPSFKVRAMDWLRDLVEDEEQEVYKEYQEASDIDAENGVEFKPCLEDDDFWDWLENSRFKDRFDEWWSEREWYPMWGSLFEAKDEFLSEKLLKNLDALYDAGIGVMDGGDYFRTLLFIAGCGYDFYEAHWVPLYVDVLGWINEWQCKKCGSSLESQDAKCKYCK